MPFQKIRSLLQLKELLEQDNLPGFIDDIKADPRKALTDIIAEPSWNEDEKIKFDTLDELKERIQRDPRVMDMLMYDPLRFLDKVVKEAPQPEFHIYRLLVGSLCVIVFIITVGMLLAWIFLNSRTAPPTITAIGCMALGLLAGTFISVPGRNMKNPEKTQHFRSRNRNNR